MPRLSRRGFLISGGVLGGAMLLGYIFTPQRLTLHPPANNKQTWLTTWVSVNTDNTITVLVPQAEMGQGILTSLPMMLAEEMEADWELVNVEKAPADGFYVTDNIAQGFTVGEMQVPESLQRLFDYSFYKVSNIMDLQITGGSASVRFTGQWGMRRAGAAAKEMLIQAAAERWSVKPEECYAKLSQIRHDGSGRYLTFGELAESAALIQPSLRPKLKSPEDYTICGRDIPRIDIPAKTTGEQQYSIDVRLENMHYAAIRHAPVFAGEVTSYDAESVKNKPGIKDIIEIPGAVVVTADNYWRAKQAVNEMSIEFSDGKNANFSSESLFKTFANKLDNDKADIDFEQGDVSERLDKAEQTIEAEYRVPFLAHATMEPLNCTAHLHDGKLDVWVGSQDPLGVRSLAAKTADIDTDAVHIHSMHLGGGFGRRISSTGNFIEDAVHIARHVDYPVQLIWSREEDMQHDYYRPATVSRFVAALDSESKPELWHNHYTDIGINQDRAAAYLPYSIANQEIGRIEHETPVPVSYWRSVEHSYQGFFRESFIDELAHHAGVDPLKYRLQLLADEPRYQAVLNMAAEKAGWGKPLPDHTALGIAIVESFGTIVAQVARVRVTDTVQVEHVVAVADPGEVINPMTARAQIESGIIFGLTAALYGKITLEKGRVVQTNFPNYEMIKLADSPDIDVYFIESGDELGGMGEVGTPPIAAAVTNAIFAVTGKRIRELPIKDQSLS